MGRAGLRQIGAALLTVALCYAPLVYVKLAGKLQSFEEPCGCRCSGAPSRAVWASSGGSRHGTVTENKPARSSSHLLAPERVAFSRFAASESSPVEAIRRGGEHLEAPSGQMSAEEAWEAYVQAAKEAAESPECRFQASKSLLAKVNLASTLQSMGILGIVDACVAPFICCANELLPPLPGVPALPSDSAGRRTEAGCCKSKSASWPRETQGVCCHGQCLRGGCEVP